MIENEVNDNKELGKMKVGLLPLFIILGLVFIVIFIDRVLIEYLYNGLSYLLLLKGSENGIYIFIIIFILIFLGGFFALRKNEKLIFKFFLFLGIIFLSISTLIKNNFFTQEFNYSGKCYIYTEGYKGDHKGFGGRYEFRYIYNYWIILDHNDDYKKLYDYREKEHLINSNDIKIKINRNIFEKLKGSYISESSDYFSLCSKNINITYLPRLKRLTKIEILSFDNSEESAEIWEKLQKEIEAIKKLKVN